ncbi:thiopurine S-methyltransferase [Spongiibacter sp.]|uniref:thiopurine S-methyltransferase n=1 Tax=Spongiibacter sp. TaxID=2024860 RepID=UPI0035643742
MDAEFWHKKWEEKDIAFHTCDANPLLVRYFDTLALAPGAGVFLPLCGKTRDIAWLSQRGMRVIGVELSAIAVEELFAELGVVPEVSRSGELRYYRGGGIEIYQGDVFALAPSQLATVEAVYDRAALVALPAEMRRRYSAHVVQLSSAAPQLLINYDYDQRAMPGPPFAISDAELQGHYAKHYQLEALYCEAVDGGLKGLCPALEKVWRLQPRGV